MRNNLFKALAVGTLFALLNQILFPVVAYALTGGPSTPEVRQFEQVGTDGMTDLFSGDFRYSIPLLNVGGYPINLSYNSNITTDQEASWVGLGWNLNVGAINRSLRGIPDEFRGDSVRTRMHMAPIDNYNLDMGPAWEILGQEQGENEPSTLPADTSWQITSAQLGLNAGISWNSRAGYSFSLGFGPDFFLSKGTESWNSALGGNTSFDSQRGLSISPVASIGHATKHKKTSLNNLGQLLGGSLNSRMGISNTNIKGAYFRTGRMGRLMLAHPTYVPKISMPWKTTTQAIRVKIGSELLGFNKADLDLNGSFSRQELLQTNRSVPAYGYRYADYHGQNTEVMLDLNREKDGAFSQNTPFLPLTNITYDQYSISGQGIGGAFRYYRGDVGVVFDTPVQSRSSSNSYGFDLAGGSAIGYTPTVIENTSQSGLWNNGQLKDSLAFQPSQANDLYESAVPIMMGEPSILDGGFFQTIGQDQAVRPKLSNGPNASPQASLEPHQGNEIPLTYQVKRSQRINRSQQITVLNALEAEKGGLVSTIENYDLNGDGFSQVNSYVRTNALPAHHASEIGVTGGDGSRYIYGIPAVNKVQRDISFGIGATTPDGTPPNADLAAGLVSYNPSILSDGKGSGPDRFYSETELPAYAYAYLLTAFLSPDYQDLAQDGPSPDDLGSYVKFNYGKVAGDYKWRMPYQTNQARHERGFREDHSDDRAHLTYGEKEVWYLKGIETRDYLATFFLSPRQDGRGVVDVNGNGYGASLQRLDSIRLYARTQYESGNPQPIQTVHFQYDESYPLCPGVPNNPNQNGKLTLKAVWTTSYDSERGSTNKYLFRYQNQYGYHLKAYDRWGSYQPPLDPGITGLNNDEFPYTVQDPDSAAAYASSWSLNQITLPSGGQIDITYEADDYAYVQDKRAMEMRSIYGFADNGLGQAIGAELRKDKRNQLFCYFELDDSVATTLEGIAYLRQQYFAGMGDHLYFRALANLNQEGEAPVEEYIVGYAELFKAQDGLPFVGFDPSSQSNGKASRAWVRLKEENAKDANINPVDAHPISLAAWQTTRLNLNHLIYPGNTPNADIGQALKGLAAAFGEFDDLFKNPNRVLRNRGYGASIQAEKSWIRLNEPHKVKYGGGVRVKSIAVNDVWNEMVGGSHKSSVYTLEYDYRRVEEYIDQAGNSASRFISSGVAAYEPLLGGDENPFRQPVNYTVRNLLAPDHRYFQEKPIGESMYPGGSVGYSRVTVRNTSHLDQNGSQSTMAHAPGYTVHEFYTARDFPTRVQQTELEEKRWRLDLSSPVFASTRDVRVAASQGFMVERNDMHGKPKAVWAYGENALDRLLGVEAAPISGTEYIYRTDPQDPQHLSNLVQVLDESAHQSTELMGITVDLVTDLREYNQRIGQVSVPVQIDVNASAPVPSTWPRVSVDLSAFRTAVATKVIDRYGIIQEVRSYDRQAMIPSENLLFDRESGQALLTRTWNEFKQPLYSFNYPAYWAYADGLGPAYRNTGYYAFPGVAGSNLGGTYLSFNSSTDLNPFLPGDEVLLKHGAQGVQEKLWVSRVNGNQLFLIDANGSSAVYAYPNGYSVEIIHSASQNQTGASMASVQTLANPMPGGIFNLDSLQTKVLASGAVDFSELWQMPLTFPDTNCVQQWQGFMDALVNTRFLNNSLNTDYLSTTFYNLGSFDLAGSYAAVGSQGTSNVNLSLDFTDCNGNILCSTGAMGFNVGLGFDINADSNKVFTLSNLQVLPDSLSGGVEVSFTVDPVSSAISGSHQVTLNCTCNPCQTLSFKAPFTNSCVLAGDSVNPWLQGIRGNWRPKRSYTYLTERAYQGSRPNLREDGTFLSYQPFWDLGTTWTAVGTSDDDWQFTAEATLYHPRGLEVESVDPLGNYAAAILGFEESLVTTKAQNSRYQELAFESFEDYVLRDSTASCMLYHFDFIEYLDQIETDFAHTGDRSLLVGSNPVILQRDLMQACTTTGQVASNGHFYVQSCDQLPLFAPQAGQKYVLFAWAHQEPLAAGAPLYKYDAPRIEISYVGSGNTEVVSPKGVVIEGWQRMEYEFTIPPGATGIRIDLINQSPGTDEVYFDDLRIAPFDAGVVSYVYHPYNRRLLAELDANHYTTFYEYDEDGSLIRTKKETERGIQTLQESRMTLAKSIQN